MAVVNVEAIEVELSCTDVQNQGLTPGVFKLAWAVVLHLYFGTTSLRVAEECGISDQTQSEAGTENRILKYSPEVARSVLVKDALHAISTRKPLNVVQDHSILSEVESNEQENPAETVQILLHISARQGGRNTSNKTDLSRENQIVLFVELERLNTAVDFIYNTDYLTGFQATNVARTLGAVIKTLLSKPNTIISELDLVSSNDKAQICEWNKTPTSPIEDCVHHIFERVASRQPSSEAIVSWDGKLSYEQLDKLSSALAHHLRENFSVGPEVVVPLCFEKSMWAVVAMLAVLKSGGAYSCLDPAHPPERRSFLLGTLKASIVLTTEKYRGLFDGYASLVVDAELLASLETFNGAAPTSGVTPSNAAVVYFTSGSTGNPKGFVHEHVSLCTGVVSNTSGQRIDDSSARVYQWAAYTFDVSVTEIYGPLVKGGCICIPSDDERMNDVAGSMVRMNVNWGYFTPSFARLVHREVIPTLKTLVMGGEAMEIDDIKKWAGKVQLINAYGPSESTVWFTTPIIQTVPKIVSVGKPFNTLGWIVDPDNTSRLMPLGAVGELLFEGPGLLRGYINEPERTQKAFLNDIPSWRKENGPPCRDKIYRTGDLVYYLPDGTMAYIGRKDAMVKLRGQRMELGEVEVNLRKLFPGSVAVDVITPAGEHQDPTLVAFLCMSEQKDASHDFSELKIRLQAQLRLSLPDFMVPRIFVPLAQMPYNSSNKLNRVELKRYGSSMTIEQLLQFGKVVGNEKSVKLSPLERSIRNIWAEILHIDVTQISTNDNFFSLGGTSMAALKIVALARDIGIDLKYVDIFQSSSLAELAQAASFTDSILNIETIPQYSLLDSTLKSLILKDITSQYNLPEHDIEDVYPLVPQQEGLWALSLIEEGDYMSQFILTLTKDVNVPKLCKAWISMVKLFSMFRTRFILSKGKSYQVVLKDSAPWRRSSSLEEYLKKDMRVPLDFGQPPTRYAVINEKDQPTKLVWTMHHALFDGETVPMFLNHVAKAYKGIQPVDSDLVPFTHFVKYLQNLPEEPSRKYWQAQLEQVSSAEFPSLPSPSYRPTPGSLFNMSTQIVRKFGSRVTTATIVQAAWALAISNATGSHDVYFGSVLAGRGASIKNLEKMMGPTFVSVPVRRIIKPQQTVLQYLEEFQTFSSERIPFEHFGMQKIRSINEQCNAACRFQSLLIIQTPDDKSYEELFECDDRRTSGMHRFNSNALMMECQLTSEGMDVSASFDENVISEQKIQDIAFAFDKYVRILSIEEDNRVLSALLDDARSSTSSRSDLDTPKSQSEATASPRTPLTSKVIKAWAEVFHRDPETIDLDDDFFDSGGNSILAMVLVGSARSLGVSITVAKLFRNPRLADLISVVSLTDTPNAFDIAPFSLIGTNDLQEKIRNEALYRCDIDGDEIKNILPATPLQAAFLSSSQHKAGIYMQQYVLKIPKNISPEAFCSIWDMIATKFDILRTRFILLNTRTYQVVVTKAPTWTKISDLDDYLRQDRKTTVKYGDPASRFAIHQGSNGSPSKMVWTAHHAVYDTLVLQSILAAADAIYHGTTLSPIASFDGFIKHIMANDEMASKAYWEREFQNWTPHVFPLLPSSSYKPSAKSSYFSKLKFARKANTNITTSILLRAAWALLAAQYSNNDDIVFGITLSGRNTPLASIERIMGPTLNTTPLRVQINAEQSVNDYLQELQHRSIEAIPFEQTPLTKLKQYGPNCQDACNFQSLLEVQITQDDLIPTDTIIDVHEAPSDIQFFNEYALLLSCNLSGDNAEVLVSFDQNVLEEDQIRRMIRQFEHLLNMLSAEDERSLKEILTVNKSELQDIVHLNRNVPVPQHICAHDMIRPGFSNSNAMAVDSWDGKITYAELDEMSDILAGYFNTLGVGPEVLVPLCFEKTKFSIVTVLGVLKAGGAFVFIDPHQPSVRHQFYLETLKAKIVLTTKLYTDIFSQFSGVKMIIIDSDLLSSLDKASMLAISLPKALPSNAAYVLMTSGTTGLPKVIVHDHISVCSSVTAHEPIMNITRTSRVAQLTAFTFDPILTEFFTTLKNGGCICFPSNDETTTGLVDFIERSRVEWIFLTPSQARTIRRDKEKSARMDRSSMKTIAMGGEKLMPQDELDWEKTVRLVNTYGTSEVQGYILGDYSNGTHRHNQTGLGIGTLPWIINPHGQLLPIGAMGEMVLSGSSVARGYLGNPSATAKTFVPRPAWLPAADPSKVVFKTGDLARMNSNGTVTILGRMDKEIKINGRRISMEEIDNTLKRILPDNVSSSVETIQTPGDTDTLSLVAFISLASTSNGTGNTEFKELAKQAQSELLSLLPAYMVPRIWLPYGPLPINGNGKLEHAKLQAYASSLSMQQLMAFMAEDSKSDDKEELTSKEEISLQVNAMIVEIVSEVDSEFASTLKGRDVHLLNSGLDSIGITSLATHISRKYNVTVPISKLIAHDMRVRDVAKLVEIGKTKAALMNGHKAQPEAPKQLMVQPKAPEQPLQVPSPQTSFKTREILSTSSVASDFSSLDAQLKELVPKPKNIAKSVSTVFLTGATGFLGIQILRELFNSPQITKVIVLVRAENARNARIRILKAAATARWWSPKLSSSLETWTGDLAKDKLGLQPAQWSRLSGTASVPEDNIDAIIHNGAIVHWGHSYEKLRPENVLSTVHLLSLLTSSTSLQAFSYVSGGQSASGDGIGWEEEVETMDGYSKSKLVSELLVKNFAERNSQAKLNVKIIKPGLIVGTSQEGVSNTDDFLWRVVAGAVRVGGFNASEKKSWLPVAGADQVASVVVQQTVASKSGDSIISILDGMTVGQFWDCVKSTLGMALRPMRLLEFVDALRADVSVHGKEHAMWPVMHWLEMADGCIGDPDIGSVEARVQGDIVASVCKSVEYLAGVGFFSDDDLLECTCSGGRVFRRSGGV